MSNFKGTKGKWEVIESTCGLITETQCISIQVGQDDIITVWDNSEESQANALLISKSPEMLEMLEKIIEGYSEAPGEMWIPDYIGNHIEDAKKLIKSATEL